jgi:Domain of unknown function (DUF397)
MPEARKPTADQLDLSGVTWRKSSFSGSVNESIEVGRLGENWLVRNSSDPEGTVLVFTPAEWRAFVLGAKAGEFDLTDG